MVHLARHVTTLDVSYDTINQHFLTIAEKTAANLPSSCISPLSHIKCTDMHADLVLSEVHVDDVLQHIQALDIHEAVVTDEIPTRLVKAAPYGMAVILMSISTCTFPDLGKTFRNPNRTPLCLIFVLYLSCLLFQIFWSNLFLIQWLAIY